MGVESRGGEFPWEIVPDSTMELIRPHQREALAFLFKRIKALISLPPGAGKTLIGCLWLLANNPSRALVICPTGKRKDWARDYQKWCGVAFTGLITTPDLLKTSHEMLKSHYSCVVFDECHSIKEVASQRTKSILPLLKRCPSICLLTGTPQMNNAYELFPLLSALEPLVFSNFYTFRDCFCDMETFYVRGREQVRYIGHKNEGVLSKILERVSYRKRDVVTTSVGFRRKMVDVGLPADEKEHFKSLMEEFRALRETDDPMIQVHVNKMWAEAGRVKAEISRVMLMNLVSKNKGGVILFCCHLDVVDKLTSYFPGCEVITGATSQKARDEVVQRMSSGLSKVGVFTVDAASEGLNLAPGVTTTVFVELHRVPSKMTQAECRAYRMGAVHDVTSYWLVLERSWDEMVLRKLQQKAMGNAMVVDGEEDNGGFEFE